MREATRVIATALLLFIVVAMAWGAEPPLEIVVQAGHNQGVKDLAFSPDERHLVSGGADGTVKLWDLREGALVRTFESGAGGVNAVAFSPDGARVAAALVGRRLVLWDLGGKLERSWDFGVSDVLTPQCVRFSPDGTLLAVAGSGNVAWLLRVRDGSRVLAVKERSATQSLTYASDGSVLYLAHWNGTITARSLPGGELLRTYEGHTGAVNGVAASRDGRWIASVGADRTLRLWSADGSATRVLPMLKGQGLDVAFAPDSLSLAVSSDSAAYLLGLEGGSLQLLPGINIATEGLCFDAQGGIVAGGNAAGAITLWRAGDGTIVRSLAGSADPIKAAAVSPGAPGSVTVVAGRTVRSWGVDGTPLGSFALPATLLPAKLAWSPDGRRLAIAFSDIWIFDSAGTAVASWKANANTLGCLAFSPSGALLASRGGRVGSGKTVDLWRIDGTRVASFPGLSADSGDIVFGPGEDTVIAADGREVKVWDIHGAPRCSFVADSAYVLGLAVSGDGQTLMSAGFTGVKLWRLDGTLLRAMEAHAPAARYVAASADGKLFASTGWDGTVQLWDARGERLRSVSIGSTAPLGICFGPDSRTILVPTAGALCVVSATTGASYWVAFSGEDWIMWSPDGLFDASRDGGRLVAAVCGMSVYRIDQFAAERNRPDVLLGRMGLDEPGLSERLEQYRSQHEKRLRRMGVREEDFGGAVHVPEARMEGVVQDGRYLSLTLRFSDSACALRSYNIWVDDVPIYGAAGRELGGREAAVTERVELTHGTNRVEAGCVNERGAESYRALTEATCAVDLQGDLYFLGFGVSRYRDSRLDLRYAAKDVRDLAAAFAAMEGDPYQAVHVRTYLDEDVTAESIRGAKSFLADATVHDTFVLFIAGHGVHDTDPAATYYYLVHAADVDDLRGTCADFDTIEELLQGVAPRNKLFLIDTCESGERDPETDVAVAAISGARGIVARAARGISVTRTAAAPPRAYLRETGRFIANDLIRRSGAIVLSSSRGDELSYESDVIENGFFTEAILGSLRDRPSDADGDGRVSTEELRAYVASAVARGTGGLQNPTVDRDNLRRRFSLPFSVPRVDAGAVGGPVDATGPRTSVLFEIYAPEAITPPGNLTLTIDLGGRSASVELERAESTIPGLALYSAWVGVPPLSPTGYPFSIRDSSGRPARGMAGEPSPTYRVLEPAKGYLWTLDAQAGKYAFREAIYHWEGPESQAPQRMTARIVDDEGRPCEATVSVSAMHQLSSSKYASRTIVSTRTAGGEVSLEAPGVRVQPGVDRLPFRDYLTVEVQKDFHNSVTLWPRPANAQSLALGEVVLRRARVASVSSVSSATGAFTGAETVAHGAFTTVSLPDFESFATAEAFRRALDPARAARYLSNRYDLDGQDGTADVSVACGAGGTLTITAARDCVVSDLGIRELPLALDLGGAQWKASVEVREPGHVLAVRTSDKGYALVWIQEVHVVTDEEIAAILASGSERP